MNARPTVEALSLHSRARVTQRKIPQPVLTHIQQGKAFIVTGFDDTNYHIVRLGSNEFAVGVEKGGVLLTIFSNKSIKNYLSSRTNNKHIIKHVATIPVFGPKKGKKSKNKVKREPKSIWV